MRSAVVTGETGFSVLNACQHPVERVRTHLLSRKPFDNGDDAARIDFVEGDVRDKERRLDVRENNDADVIVRRTATPLYGIKTRFRRWQSTE
ncbi:MULTISPECIES: hypothetical protein [Natrialbaceae]|uniref:hypothetical protein n=1 Tax=Natrialbaceae TaxID=1644061 RepID=UPI00207C1965|nr:hypothetical protein [Natronococcus sp. CG52]